MTKSKLFTAALLATLFSTPAFAAEAESDAGAKIIAPLQISNSTALYFGTIAPSVTESDTVLVSPQGAKTCGVELTCMTDDHTAAEFRVTGEADASYTIALPTQIQLSNGAGMNMTVNDFTGSKANGTLVAGQDDFTVGGTLEVGANQSSGEYTGTFIVTVEYQ